MYDVKDLTMEPPMFRNAPRFNLNQSLRGREIPFGQPRNTNTNRLDRRNDNLYKLVDIIQEQVGDGYTVRVFRGNLILIPNKDAAKHQLRDNKNKKGRGRGGNASRKNKSRRP